jgi:hypothetical protein
LARNEKASEEEEEEESKEWVQIGAETEVRHLEVQVWVCR